MGQTGQIIPHGRRTQIRVVQNGDIALIELVWLWAQLRNALYNSHVGQIRMLQIQYIHRAYFR